MFTQPQITTSEDIKYRSFISYYFDNVRFKHYNGNKLNLTIFPNYAKTIKDKNSLLRQLQYEFYKALSNGWNPTEIEEAKEIIKVKSCFSEVLKEKLNSQYSKTYKRDLKKTCEQFLAFLPPTLLDKDLNKIPQSIIEQFLNQFKSSARHYMNKRLSMSVFYSELVRKDYIAKNPISKTSRQKIKATLHEIYSDEQMKEVLTFLKLNYFNLYLCAIITYGCLLRPHQEVRQLKRKHINSDFTKIYLSGDENKSGRIRVVFIPSYLQEILKSHLDGITNTEANIFTLTDVTTYNDDYFKTQWSRAKLRMLDLEIISKNQTIYSFRHTAAVSVYRKTKDLNIVQQLLGHSDMIVTLNYLRGLGEATNEELKNVMPELNYY
jgi:integrase